MTSGGAPLVFITGASSGIGQALAERFLRGGYRLALVARRAAALEAWTEGHGLGPERCRSYAADVSDIDAITEAGRACIAQMGLPDVVIANAGISVGVDTAEFEDLAVIRRLFDTNNLGMAATFQPFVAGMRARRSGRLVGIASVAGIRGLPGHGAYCASKAGVIAYCESLRGEMRPFGVQVVTVVPGYIDTPLTRENRYPMPFLMSADAFADRAFHAIEQGERYRTIPWQMGGVAWAMRLLPRAVFDRLMEGRPRKHRQAVVNKD